MTTRADERESDALLAPSLTALLGCRGNLFAIASVCWNDDETPVIRLDADTVYAVAEWALAEVADSQEGIALSRVCEAYGQTPSAYLGLDDAVLAWGFDAACLANERVSTQENRREEGNAIRFSVPDVGGGT